MLDFMCVLRNWRQSKAHMKSSMLDANLEIVDGYTDTQWPVYPDIGEFYAVPSSYVWRFGPDYIDGLIPYLRFAFKNYEREGIRRGNLKIGSGTLAEHNKQSPFKNFSLTFNRVGFERLGNGRMLNPYKNKDESPVFGRGPVTTPPPGQIDPVTRAISIGRNDKIATMGSCFAQHLSKHIQKKGFNYFVAEAAPTEMSLSDVKRKNYGVLSLHAMETFIPCVRRFS